MRHDTKLRRILSASPGAQERFEADMRSIPVPRHANERELYQMQQLRYACALRDLRTVTPELFWDVDGEVSLADPTTYDFGEGPVPAHRHIKGRGWVADTATVSKMAYVGPHARVFGYARVRSFAKVYDNAVVKDDAVIEVGGAVFGSEVVGGRERRSQ
jgi:hypothetical protein